ncbi:DUF3854 domain-containing protein [Candidatus Parcubacteria bacterium]|nr:MAG: DUF3854 domain-containing protein [Candidatus Parcubacteria bacterium]
MDFDKLEGLADYFEGNGKSPEIYSAFLRKASLEPEDREALKKERGFSDDIINLCQFVSCSPKNRKIIEELQQTFDEADLLESGILEITEKGLVPCSQLLGIYNKKNQFVNNICIPYFDAEGRVFYLRPHKFGFKGKGINVYTPVRKIDNSKPLILAESEFKAAAAIQFGYPAIGVPGIHSFAVNNFDRLRDLIETLNVAELIVMYDNEIKNNPKFPNFKTEVLKQWDTQWRAVDITRKLMSALPSLKVRIASLPESWMVDGKIDIDGALAQKRTTSEFRNVVLRAKDWNDYVDGLPLVARKIIQRKVLREIHLERCQVKKVTSLGDPLGPIGYYIRRDLKVKGEAASYVWESVTNFTMDIQKTLVEGNDYIREVVFKNQDGTYSPAHMCIKGNNLLREFKIWGWSCGDYHFEGNQDDLNKIWRLEGMLCDGREIMRPEQIGYIANKQEPVWLLGNMLIKNDGSILTNGEDGIIWDGLVGYLPRSIRDDKDQATTKDITNSKVPTINLDKDISFGMPELRAVAKDIENILGTKTVSLALGWLVANLFSDEIFKKHASFPILWIAGKRESGKTTLGNWLMALGGQSGTDKAGDALENSTPAGVLRNLSWFSNLPYWVDEYRNDATAKKWDSFFRNIYQRQGPSKGTLGKHIRSLDVNACLIVSGEETPQDNALLSRCIVIALAKRKKDNSDIYRKLENYRMQNLLSRFIYEIIKQRQNLLPLILTSIEGYKKDLLKEGVGDRVSLNYAIAAACYEKIFLADEDLETVKAYKAWVAKESFYNEQEKEREHMLSIFMDDIVAMAERLKPHYTVYSQEKEPKGKKRIALHFPSFYNEWSKEARRKGMEPFKRQTILSYIRDEKYYIKDNEVKRIYSKPVRSLILSLDECDSPPDALNYLAACTSETTDDLTKAVQIAVEEEEHELF